MNVQEFERSVYQILKDKAAAIDAYYQGLSGDDQINSTTTIYAAGPQDADKTIYPIIKMSRTTLIANMELERQGSIFIPSGTTITKPNGEETPDSYSEVPHPKSYKSRVYFYCNSLNNQDQRKLAEVILLAFPNGGYLRTIDASEQFYCKPYTNISTPISGDKVLEDTFIYDMTEIFIEDPTITGINRTIITDIDFDINIIE